MALTPNDVLNKQFQTTKFRDGYDQDEVDDFLDEVLAEFQRLIAENEQLKTQVGSAPAVSGTEVEELRAQLAAATAQLAETQRQLKAAQDEAASGSPMLDGMNSAEYLQLARRVHEEHVREGVAKRDEAIAEGETKAAQVVAEAQAKHDQLIGEAETKAAEVTSEAQAKADTLVTEAQAKADTLVTEAQSKADELVSEAQAQRDTQLAALAEEVRALGGERDELQGAVDGLKEFERNYRSTLTSYLKTQLGELEAAGEEPAASVEASEPETVEADDVEDVEDSTSQPVSAFQWAPPVPHFESASASESDIESTDGETTDSGEHSTSGTPPVPGFGGN